MSPKYASKGMTAMKIFMLDNYDSFTYNLVQYFQILGCDVTARRCDCTLKVVQNRHDTQVKMTF